MLTPIKCHQKQIQFFLTIFGFLLCFWYSFWIRLSITNFRTRGWITTSVVFLRVFPLYKGQAKHKQFSANTWHFSSVASFLSMLSMLLMVIQPANDVMIINDLVEEVGQHLGLKFLDLSNYEFLPVIWIWPRFTK